jgi:DNA-directed RNA polymerase
MTTVYGVTFVGARDQIEKRLEETGQIPIEECWQASSYLAKKVRLSCRVYTAINFIHLPRRYYCVLVTCSAARKGYSSG